MSRPLLLRARRFLLAAAGLAAAFAPLAAGATPSLLIDVETGKVLIEEGATKPWYPASVTKLMTTYVTFRAMREGRVSPDTLITVSDFAVAQQPSKMGFRAGTQLTVDNALKMLLVKSANDMAVVLAEGVGGSVPGFVDEMNRAAASLGMTGTHYANPNGLPDPEQVTTARDLAILARALIKEFPEHEDMFRIPAIKLGNRVLRNYNRLIDRYPGADGMKTGFICASGFNLVASAHRGNKRVLAVVLGADSAKDRTEQAALLLEKGFQQSWSIFGAVSPTVDSLRNESGPPTDMRARICGGKRKQVASEGEDDDAGGRSTGFAAAGMGSLGANVTGASLLVNLPPSMAPVPVWVGPTRDQAALDAAFPPPPEKPAKKNAAKKDPAAKPAAAGAPPAAKKPPVAAVSAPATDAGAPAKPATKPAAKPAAKTAATSPAAATDAVAPAAASPATVPKPAAEAKPASTTKPAAALAKPAAPKPAAAAAPKPAVAAPKPAAAAPGAKAADAKPAAKPVPPVPAPKPAG
ncbi:MAG TPA: D-alanyl-D-alanine carboxypeptidase family protein [Xanthobacteraceae bacterium]|nr:D-alanyl-D-alanine carboxypeptidase family protein [Xanthobacteraceae bacterium]